MSELPQSDLSLKDFDYELDPELIAQSPSEHREGARLLVRTKSGEMRHRLISDLAEEIPMGSLVIVNDSRVMNSRLIGKLPTGGKIEVFLMEPMTSTFTGKLDGPSNSQWRVLGKPVRKLGKGTQIIFSDDVVATVTEEPDRNFDPPAIAVEFNKNSVELMQWVEKAGATPLPPYISRADASAELSAMDKIRYQTVYSNEKGGVAAPTAGLHYTPELMNKIITEKNAEFATVTLHVGAGTFLPVKTENLSEHQMHTERYMVPAQTLEMILAAKKSKRPIVIVGTTTLRCLESFWLDADRNELSAKGRTDTWHKTKLFIRPANDSHKYKPWACDILQTNFHQPKSTLIMLVSALAGVQEIKSLYQVAVQMRYRFFSYGDSSLIWL